MYENFKLREPAFVFGIKNNPSNNNIVRLDLELSNHNDIKGIFRGKEAKIIKRSIDNDNDLTDYYLVYKFKNETNYIKININKSILNENESKLNSIINKDFNYKAFFKNPYGNKLRLELIPKEIGNKVKVSDFIKSLYVDNPYYFSKYDYPQVLKLNFVQKPFADMLLNSTDFSIDKVNYVYLNNKNFDKKLNNPNYKFGYFLTFKYRGIHNKVLLKAHGESLKMLEYLYKNNKELKRVYLDYNNNEQSLNLTFRSIYNLSWARTGDNPSKLKFLTPSDKLEKLISTEPNEELRKKYIREYDKLSNLLR